MTAAAPDHDTGAVICTCLAKVEASLQSHNTRLAVTFQLDRERHQLRCLPLIAVEKIEPRGKRPVVVVPTFCPFCGVRCLPESTPTSHQE